MIKRLVVLVIMVPAILLSLSSRSGAQWFHDFALQGNCTDDKVFMSSDASAFLGNGFEDIRPQTWSAELITSPSGYSGAQASGPEVSELLFKLHFSTDRNVPFDFDFFAYLNGNQVGSASASWSGQDWTIESRGNINLAANVPLPGTLLLLSTGLIGLAASRGRRMRG